MNREQPNLFFQVIAIHYEKGGLIVTCKLPFSQRDTTTFAQDGTLTSANLIVCCTMQASCQSPVRVTASNISVPPEWCSRSGRSCCGMSREYMTT